MEKNKIVHKAAHLIRPPSRQFMFTYIHGISWNDVAAQPTFGDIWSEISEYFEGVDFIAAHNASFDSGVLRACCARYEIEIPAVPFTCTVQVARNTWDIYPTKLPDVCKYLDIKLNHHDALSDALACAHIVMAAQREKPKAKGKMPLKRGTAQVPLKGKQII